ncbi:hypothetical protein WICMUC_004433 [Wickerhamomyces mucosus]|uniref:PUM-HD domain-containing protein n=1 Tax=Wickerhamomyces mucosus TaxID=1378264 RepID=A0A9P8PHZ9_9ASCO|nr:hypothetical protein WICMUC_004433 [Wickerhamomyces mucosus]
MTKNQSSGHQQNLSINSLNSIIEPLTPPDHSHYLQQQQQKINRSNSTSVSDNSYTATALFNVINSNSSKNNAYNITTNSLLNSNNTTPINSNIGGNTFRSRLKSLPLMNELDQKFNQFNLNSTPSNLESLNTSIISPSPNGSISNNLIPQIPLGQYNIKPPSNTDKSSTNTISSIQRHSSLSGTPSTTSSGLNNITTTSSIYKNFDELNAIPIENLDIVKLSIDQYGCRFIQKRLDLDNSIKDIVFNKIFNNIIDLIVDPFGNYLIQKLVDYLTSYQKDLMIEKIHTYLFQISTNQYGTRSLQKIIDKISNSYQMDLIIKGLQENNSLDPIEDNNVVRLIKDLNGNHVIQKCIFKFTSDKIQFIIDSICLNNNIVRISTHKHGCCVLQKLLNNANYDQIVEISKVLLIYLNDLINDQFGNYIIQFLFELSFLQRSENLNFLIDEFFQKIFNNMVKLSCLKFSSNVIEKFIKILKNKQNYIYLTEIIKLTNINFEILIKDKFGNYVIQTLIDQFYDVIELNLEMANLINTIKNYLPVIKTAPYGRKIQLKIQQLESNIVLGHSPSNSFSYNVNSHQHNFNKLNSEYQLSSSLKQLQPPMNQSNGYFDYQYHNTKRNPNLNLYYPSNDHHDTNIYQTPKHLHHQRDQSNYISTNYDYGFPQNSYINGTPR